MTDVATELLRWMVSSELKRIRLGYGFEETLIIPQVDSKGLKLPGLGEMTFEKGKAMRIYRGIAGQLVDSGLVKIGEEPLNLKDVTTMRWLESSEEGLIKLPEYFYIRSVRLIQGMGGKVHEVQNDLQEILDIRLRKIIKLVFLKDVPMNILEKLQPEEIFLYDILREALNIWRTELISGDGE